MMKEYQEQQQRGALPGGNGGSSGIGSQFISSLNISPKVKLS